MPAIWAIRCNARFMRPEETVIQAPCTGFSTALVDTGYCKRRRASCPTGARDQPDAFPAPGSERGPQIELHRLRLDPGGFFGLFRPVGFSGIAGTGVLRGID